MRVFALAGTDNVSVGIAGCTTSLASISIPSERKRFRRIILKFSDLRSCLRERPGFKTAMKEFTGHVEGTRFDLGKRACRLRGGGGRRSVRNKAGKFGHRIFGASAFCAIGSATVIMFGCGDARLRNKFPNGVRLSVTCGLAGRGRVILRCATAASGPAMIGFAGRDCFGLANYAEGILGRVCEVCTSSVAPASSVNVPAKRLVPIINAMCSCASPRSIRGEMRGVKGKCSIGCELSGCPSSLRLTTVMIRPVSNEILGTCAARPKVRFCVPGSGVSCLVNRNRGGCNQCCKFYLRVRRFPSTPGGPRFPTADLLPKRVCQRIAVCGFRAVSRWCVWSAGICWL